MFYKQVLFAKNKKIIKQNLLLFEHVEDEFKKFNYKNMFFNLWQKRYCQLKD